MEKKESEGKQNSKQNDDGEDPGYVFMFNTATSVHDCMNAAVLANIHSPLVRGKKVSLRMEVNYFMWRFSGANAIQSLRNLNDWLDNIALTIRSQSVVLDRHGQRVEAFTIR